MCKMDGGKERNKTYKNQIVMVGTLYLPAVCKVKTTSGFQHLVAERCICLLFAR